MLQLYVFLLNSEVGKHFPRFTLAFGHIDVTGFALPICVYEQSSENQPLLKKADLARGTLILPLTSGQAP